MNEQVLSKDLPFKVSEYEKRLEKLKKIMETNNIDILLVNDPVDLNYLLGYRSWGYTFLDWQVLVISLDRDPLLVTRKLEATNFHFQTHINNIITFDDEEDPIDKTFKTIKSLGTNNKVLALPCNSWFLNAKHYIALRENLSKMFKIVDGTDITMKCRMIKSAEEISCIKRAANMTSKVMNGVKDSCLFTPTENEIASRVMSDLITLGSELPATPPLIGIGKRSTFGHPTWENYKSKTGDIIFLEFSGCVYRYHAPIMRTLSIGEPSDKAKKFEETSRELVNKIINTIEVGMEVKEIDKLAKQYLESKNMNDYFHNRIGYSVGIGFTRWLDGISIKKDVETKLAKNMVFHIIPFITDFDISVSISETILITENGAEKLTNVPQEIMVLNN